MSRAARIYDSVRTAHLERFATMVPADVLYRSRRYDFDESLVCGSRRLQQMGRLATVARLLRSRYEAVEVNEPLMTGRWLDVAQQIAAVHASSLLRRPRARIGAYCIGLTDPVEKLTMRRHLPLWFARAWSRLVLGVLVRSMDRLAFGTEDSLALLGRYVDADVLAARARLFPAVSVACSCSADAAKDPSKVLFVGAFSDRKGIRQLMWAWEVLAARDQRLQLQLIGKGPLLPDVEMWAAGRDSVSVLADPPRAEIHQALRAAHVVVLLSQRIGFWREQVGLPIVEGLAHGCEVVTTDETGLAHWLREHGHTVLAVTSSPAETAAAIGDAAASDRLSADIVADLPTNDPRADADRWLLAGEEPPPARARLRPKSGSASAQHYAASARRSISRYGVSPGQLFAQFDDRPVFVVGSPRSGTTFTAETIGSVSGFADLGELRPFKAAIPDMVALPPAEAAERIRAIVRRAQRVGLVAGRRGIEQTPESTYLIPEIAQAFPDGRFVHLVRDGRDVAASLVQLGWVRNTPQELADEVGQNFGSHARFWVEAQRRAEFADASEATRAAWVWRRYETTARQLLQQVGPHSIDVRYEELVADPAAVARQLAAFLGVPEQSDEFVAAFSRTSSSASGRWRKDLDALQLADVTTEAGALLADLGYR